MSDTLTISDAARKLRSITGRKMGYQTVWRRVQDGDLPAEKNAAGRWMIKREDVADIAAKLTQGE